MVYNCTKRFIVATRIVTIKDESGYITLQSLLKLTGVIHTGGMAKVFLNENVVLVNEEQENRRGRKLYPGDVVKVLNQVFEVK